MKLLIPSILFSLSLAASALAADYVADVRLEPTDEDFLTLPFNENHEIHKAPDATMRHPMAFENGRPVEYAESALGLSVDLTEFGCDGENVCFKFALEMRELVGWKTDQEWRMPVVSSRAFYSTPASAPRTGKLGEWIDFSSCGSKGCESNDTGFHPSLRIRKADSLSVEEESVKKGQTP